MEVLLLHLDAPLMSFGGVMVDARGDTQDFPALSMLTGLLANALGYRHGEAARLERLQERLRYAVREDRRGRRLRDFQTLDLGQDFLRQGWTTRGTPESRSGGTAKTATHIRERWYLVGALYLVALTLEPAAEEPTLENLEEALRHPARPLFLGRKSCLPARPLVAPGNARREAESLYEALHSAPPVRGWRELARGAAEGGAPFEPEPVEPQPFAAQPGPAQPAENEFVAFADALGGGAEAPPADDSPPPTCRAWWPADGEEAPPGVTPVEVRDRRDWRNQIHVGRRLLWQGEVEPASPAAAEGGES